MLSAACTLLLLIAAHEQRVMCACAQAEHKLEQFSRVLRLQAPAYLSLDVFGLEHRLHDQACGSSCTSVHCSQQAWIDPLQCRHS